MTAECDGFNQVLSVRNLSKTFAGNTVLANFDFGLAAGEIHALVGENGSGKSTFIKCLAGFHTPDEGSEIAIVGDKKALPYTAADAMRFGLGFVHQNLALIPTLSVAENIGLYKRYSTSLLGKIDWTSLNAAATRALAGFASHIDPTSPVNRLAQADKTLVAIARGLSLSGTGARVLVLDEPTAALPVEEVDHLLRALKALARQGVALIYVSHRLAEVLALADTVTALRDGKRVATLNASQLTEASLVQLIVGRSLQKIAAKPVSTKQPSPLINVKNLSGQRIRNLDLTIGRGEIIGVAGLLGAGRSELGRLLFGAQPISSGVVLLEGQPVSLKTSRDAIRNGIGYIPEDRLGKGGFSLMTISENLTIANMSAFWRRGRLRRSDEKRAVLSLIEKFNIRPSNPAAVFGTLSGGNQQKTILARMLRLNPRFMILDEPAQGVDVGSKSEIFAIIRAAADKGASFLMIDADFGNLCSISDRIVVLHKGQIIREITGAERTPENVTDAVMGARRENQCVSVG